MLRTALLLAALLALAAPARAADAAKGQKAAFEVYEAYFERNDSGLKGGASYLALTDKDGFAKVFAARPPLMGKPRPALLAAGAFDKRFVAAVVTRGNAVTTYAVEAVTLDANGTVYVQYKADTGPAGPATFASPLVVSVPKEGAKKVVFIENGKTVGTADVK